jgi:hypothetical protein
LPRLYVTTKSLVEDYLNLCRNPLDDIQQWIVATTIKTGSAHAKRSSHLPANGEYGLCGQILPPLSGRLDALSERWQRGACDHLLSARPGTGAAQHHQMRSLRDAGGLAGPLDELMPADTPDFYDSGSEIAAIAGYYAGLIAAARRSLRPADAAAVVRRLRDEKIMVTRAAKNRRRRVMVRHARKPVQPSYA